MIRMLVQYRVKPGAVDEVKQAVTDFVDGIRKHEPDTIYGSFIGEDERSFVHAMAFSDSAAEKRHRAAAYTEAFVARLYPNCELEPTFMRLQLVRSTKKGGGFLGMG